MDLLIVYIIMAVSAVGALVSGLVFKRHTWRVLMLLGCLAIFVAMLMIVDFHYGWRRGTGKIIAVASCLVLFVLSFKIKKTED